MIGEMLLILLGLLVVFGGGVVVGISITDRPDRGSGGRHVREDEQ